VLLDVLLKICPKSLAVLCLHDCMLVCLVILRMRVIKKIIKLKKIFGEKKTFVHSVLGKLLRNQSNCLTKFEKLCEISGFLCGAFDIFFLMQCCSALLGSCLWTCRKNIKVPSSRTKQSS